MMPWEKYSQDTAASAIGPWDKYKSGVTTAATPSAAAEHPQNMSAFVGGNLSKGVADVAGLPVDLSSSAIEGTKALANRILGTHLKATQAPVGGSEWLKQKFGQVGAIGPSAEHVRQDSASLQQGLKPRLPPFCRGAGQRHCRVSQQRPEV